MEHYNELQWKLFSENLIDESQQLEMQNHLLECQQCLELYLDAIEEKSMLEPSIISKDFTEKVMKEVTVENRKRTRETFKKKRKNIIACYFAASFITIFFMWSGVFQRVVDTSPRASGEIASANLKKNTIFVSGWTDKLTEGTSSLVNNFNLKDFEFKNNKEKDK